MNKCKKHDDQMTEWIMCLKAAKEVWDAAFLKDDKYEVNMCANLIFDLAREIRDERLAMRKPFASASDIRLSRIVRNAMAIAAPGRGAIMPQEEEDDGDERRGEPEQNSSRH